MKKTYDFSGYASRYNVKCSDGRTILPGAFKDMDGQTVTLTWQHDHSTPVCVVGNALIEHREDGPYMYGSFNNTYEAQHAKEAVNHGDIKYLSIFANQLKEHAGNVMHGLIREVSLVYGGANRGAYIDHATLAHGDGTYSEVESEASIFMDGSIDSLSHSDKETDVAKKRSIEDVIDEMTPEQQAVVAYLLEHPEEAGDEDVEHDEDEDDEDDDLDDEDYDEDDDDYYDDEDDSDAVEHSEGDNYMSWNAFENGNEAPRPNYLTHADQKEILDLAKTSGCGTFKKALKNYCEENSLMHADDDTSPNANGFDGITPLYPTMSNNPADAYYTTMTAMLPEFKDVRGGKPPELIDYDMSWVATVMRKVNKLPFSRVRTSQIDIRDAETRESLRAKGYQKGNRKVPSGNIKLARRTTDPQTIYARTDLHRDDIVDITEFDYVNYLYQLNQKFFKEELATAILFGDNRDDGDPDKIFPEHIRPIWTDDELYTRHIELDLTAARSELQGTETDSYFGENYITAEAMINTLLYGREDHLGTGTPDLFITQHMMNVMLLARDRNGRRIYSNKSELATALNVGEVITGKQFENRIRTDARGQKWKLVALLVNLGDYSIGNTKGGEITHFTQFDIDFNKEKSLIEGRYSGALTRIQSAMVIEEKYTEQNPNP